MMDGGWAQQGAPSTEETAGGVSRRALLAQSAMVGAVGAACLPGLGQTARQGPQPASLWALGRGNVEFDQKYVQQFVDANPGMQVKLEPLAGTFEEQVEKAKILAASGSAPDVFVHLDCAQAAPIVGGGGVLEPLDGYIGRDATVNIKEIEPEVQLQYRVARKTYGIARGIALGTMYYNQDLFAAAGIPAPPAAWGHRNWQIDAVLDLARRLTRRDSDGRLLVSGLVLRTAVTWGDIAGAWITSNGGAFLDDLETPRQCLLERREALDVLQLLVDLGPKLGVAPTSADLQGQSPQQWFARGRAAMYLGSAFEVGALRRDATLSWDVSPQPWFKRPAVVLGGSGNSMSAASKAKDAAWALVKYLASAEIQRARLSLGGDAPTRSSVLYGPDYLNDAPPPKSRRVMAESVKYGRALNFRSANATELRAAWVPAPLINGQMTPVAFAQEMCRKVSPYLQK